eukprot:TRINITY_DN2714_c0_g1_i4.p2 TRINITY_DN2714_c0_g1~~TRINITY_DN2714_c0_g1_i4.p2  ORF type:complete len:281 (-),score=-9.76 TRINITY_DN2714_c0_g1_i4:224-1066(-)
MQFENKPTVQVQYQKQQKEKDITQDLRDNLFFLSIFRRVLQKRIVPSKQNIKRQFQHQFQNTVQKAVFFSSSKQVTVLHAMKVGHSSHTKKLLWAQYINVKYQWKKIFNVRLTNFFQLSQQYSIILYPNYSKQFREHKSTKVKNAQKYGFGFWIKEVQIRYDKTVLSCIRHSSYNYKYKRTNIKERNHQEIKNQLNTASQRQKIIRKQKNKTFQFIPVSMTNMQKQTQNFQKSSLICLLQTNIFLEDNQLNQELSRMQSILFFQHNSIYQSKELNYNLIK